MGAVCALQLLNTSFSHEPPDTVILICLRVRLTTQKFTTNSHPTTPSLYNIERGRGQIE